MDPWPDRPPPRGGRRAPTSPRPGALGNRAPTDIHQTVHDPSWSASIAEYAHWVTGQNIRSTKGEKPPWQTE